MIYYHKITKRNKLKIKYLIDQLSYNIGKKIIICHKEKTIVFKQNKLSSITLIKS